jgi:hypothetical protein
LFLQWLLQLAVKRHSFRPHGAQPVEPHTCKPGCDTMLGDVYYAHTKIHGANKLLPVDVLPARRSVHRRARTKADAEPARGRRALVH